MLRITIDDRPQMTTFRLEGRLAEPWVRELETCWRSTLARQGKPNLCMDLTGVTFIDAAGQAILAAMHRQGAEFIAADCVTKALVAEISQTPIGAFESCNGDDERRPQRNRGAT
jgi:anti-anti-sigma regulatory factor